MHLCAASFCYCAIGFWSCTESVLDSGAVPRVYWILELYRECDKKKSFYILLNVLLFICIYNLIVL